MSYGLPPINDTQPVVSSTSDECCDADKPLTIGIDTDEPDMPATLSTSNRIYILALKNYGEDEVLIEEVRGHEGISELFEFRLKLLSYSDSIDPNRIVGESAILRIETWDTHHTEGRRHWNGYVSRFACTGRMMSPDGEALDIYSYECDIVPWLWFMTHHEDCRIFQNKSVMDIIETIFEEFGYSDYKLELNKTYPNLEYCTQYNETTFAFISRLLEREGIHYYFRHDEGSETKHLLVFTDNREGNPLLEPSTILYHHQGHAEGTDAIRSLVSDQQMRTRRVTFSDWDYDKKQAVCKDTPTLLELASDVELERYRYPGGYAKQSGSSDAEQGKHLTTVAMEAEESSHLRFTGEGQARSLAPGHVFNLSGHFLPAFDTEYLVLTVDHRGHNNLMAESGASDDSNTFTLQHHERVFRAPITTRRGRVLGPQTALVVGPPGEELFVDNLGRIKIRFHLDRNVPGRTTNTTDDKASCWVRVAQMWAGNQYGTMFVPRIGMEVVVDFLEGDPDRPIVVGCVYNGKNTPPYALPEHATRSTFKTLSSKGGGGFNELRFEDKKGDEEIFLHAQKNLQQRVLNDHVAWVGNESHLIANKDAKTQYGADAHVTTQGNSIITVQGEQHLGATGSITFSTNSDFHQKSGMNLVAEAGVNLHLKAGMNLVLDAGTTLSFKAGGSSLVIGPSGVSITGPMVMINSGGPPGMAANSANQADTAKLPTEAVKDTAGSVPNPAQQLQAQALRIAAVRGTPFCQDCEAARRTLEALRRA